MEKRIDEILKVPFSMRTKDERLKIIFEGKPRPILPIFSAFPAAGCDKIDETCYDKEVWLTACHQRNTFYCWACLLFAREAKSEWATDGYSDYNNLYESISRHNMTTGHMCADLQLRMFIQQNISPSIPQTSNENATKNRELLKQVLDLVRNIATHAPYPAEGTSTELHTYIRETCTELLSFRQMYETGSSASEEAVVKLVNDSKLLANCVKVLSDMTRAKIMEEMRSCASVSLILSEHSAKSKLSVMLRYAKYGKVQERFVGFKCKLDKNPDSIAKHMLEVLSDYNIKDKLICFSCDGAVLPTSQLQGLVNLVHLVTPLDSCHFVPCHFHPLDLIIEQCLSQYTECAFFFKTVACVKEFLKGSHRVRAAFYNFTISTTKNTSMDFDFAASNWYFARAVKYYRIEFVKFFKHMVHNPQEWTDDDVTTAMGLYKALEEYEIIFVSQVSYALSDYLKTSSDVLNVFEDAVSSIVVDLKNMAKMDFHKLWLKSCAEKAGPSSSTATSALGMELSETLAKGGFKRKYSELFEKIILTVAEEISIRFSSRKSLGFFHLLNLEIQIKRPDSSWIDACGRRFITSDLIKELRGIKRILGPKIPREVLKALYDKDLQGMFARNGILIKNVLKLAEIILAMPCKAPYVEAKKSMLDRIDLDDENKPTTQGGNTAKFDVVNFWSTLISSEEEITNDWSVICIEQDIFKSIVSQKPYFDEFVNRFQALNSTLQL